MPGPKLQTFAERLAETLERARRAGALDSASFESLLLDPEFDDREFERFRQSATRAGVALPEDAEEREWSVPEPHPAGDSERGLLDRYLDEIGRIPLLEHEQLLVLAARARRGDDEARKRIILANLRLVVFLARAYRHRGLPMLDLIEEGNVGLIQAVDRFEPERRLRFSTYASLWIRQSMLRGVAEQSRAVRIPVQMFQQVHRFLRAERALRARLEREPRHDEIAAELGISVLRTERLGSLVKGLRSLDEGSSMEAFEQLSTEDVLEGPPSVERWVELQLEHAQLDRLLRSLSQREEQILRIRYGFESGVAHTLAQTGQHFGITRERVRQIEARALEKLRRAIELQSLEDRSGATVH